LVRRAGICVRGTIGADGENAEPGATEESGVPGAGGQNHRAEAERPSDQRDAENDRDAAAVSAVPVLSDDVSKGLPEWRCVLSMRAAAEDCRQFIERRIAQEDFRARQPDVRRNP